MKKIWLYGASRGLGLTMAQHFSDQGYQVNAMVRDLNKVQDSNIKNLTYSQGDALNSFDIKNFMKHAQTDDWVLSCMGSFNVNFPVDYIGHRHLINHLQDKKIQRFLMVTSLGCGDSWQYLSDEAKKAFGQTLREKSLAESWLQTSRLDYTILRPAGLRDGPATGNAQLSQGKELHGLISRNEVTRLVEQLLKQKEAIKQIYDCVDPTLQK